MSYKRLKKNAANNNKNINDNKKVSKNKKNPTLRLDNNAEIPAKSIYMKDTKCFKIHDVDINKIRVSDKKLYSKEHSLYKYYVFYEDDDECIPLKIVLKDVLGYYNDYKNNCKYDTKHCAKKMNFKVDDDYW